MAVARTRYWHLRSFAEDCLRCQRQHHNFRSSDQGKTSPITRHFNIEASSRFTELSGWLGLEALYQGQRCVHLTGVQTRETLQATTWAFHDDDARYYAKGQVNGFVCFSTMMRLLVDDSIQKQDVCMMGLVIVFFTFSGGSACWAALHSSPTGQGMELVPMDGCMSAGRGA